LSSECGRRGSCCWGSISGLHGCAASGPGCLWTPTSSRLLLLLLHLGASGHSIWCASWDPCRRGMGCRSRSSSCSSCAAALGGGGHLTIAHGLRASHGTAAASTSALAAPAVRHTTRCTVTLPTTPSPLLGLVHLLRLLVAPGALHVAGTAAALVPLPALLLLLGRFKRRPISCRITACLLLCAQCLRCSRGCSGCRRSHVTRQHRRTTAAATPAPCTPATARSAATTPAHNLTLLRLHALPPRCCCCSASARTSGRSALLLLARHRLADAIRFTHRHRRIDRCTCSSCAPAAAGAPQPCHLLLLLVATASATRTACTGTSSGRCGSCRCSSGC